MMKLISIPSPNKPEIEEIVLLCGKEYSVGRKQQDISLAKDTSISRNHATVQVDHPMANVTNAALTPSLVITDQGSKFGTFINDGIDGNRPVSMREPNTLSHGDRFRFGLGSNMFKIQYTPLVATSSCLKATAPLKKNICALGGHLVPEWTDKCDFLVMDNLTLTVKVVCALLSAKHIVTPQYFQDYYDAVKCKTTKVPKPEDYLPTLAETSLPKEISFSPDTQRTKLFRGKTFLFASARQSKKIGVAIKCGGGNIDLIPNVRQIVLQSPDTLIVAPQDETITSGPCANPVEIYEKSNKRIIQESEIGLAAVFISIERHCNPFYSFSKKTVFPNLASQTQSDASGSIESEPLSQQPLQRTVMTQSQSDVSRVEDSVAETSPPKRPGSKETEVAAAKVKRENDDERGEDDISTYASAAKSGQSKDSSSGSSGKRRLNSPEGQSAAPNAKKVRQLASPTSANSSQRTTRSTASKILCSVFNMSDSDDDETETSGLTGNGVIVPDSQGSFQRVTRSQVLKSPEKLVIPDSQTTPGKERSPSKSPSKSPRARASHQPVEKAPAIAPGAGTSIQGDVSSVHDDADIQQEIPHVEPEPEVEAGGRSKRKRTEVAEGNDNAIMPPPSIPAKKIKRAPSDFERTPIASTSKRQGWHETSISVKQDKKGTVAVPGANDGSLEILKPLKVAFRSILVKRNIMPELEKVDNNTIKNFKVFKKVAPLVPSTTVTITGSVLSNNSVRTTNTKRTGVTTRTTRSNITFRRHISYPTEPLVVENVPPRASQEIPDFSFD